MKTVKGRCFLMTLSVTYNPQIEFLEKLMDGIYHNWKKLTAALQRENVHSIVIQPEKVVHLCIKSVSSEVETRQAFNDKLVIQEYTGNIRKIVVYLPKAWAGTVEVTTVKGHTSLKLF